MDCHDAGIRLNDLVAGRLPRAEREEIEEHLRHCPACAAAAVSLAHPGEERALWEHAGRAMVRRANSTETAPKPQEARPPVILRHAPKPKKKRIHVPIPTRLLQIMSLGLVAAILGLCVPHFGHWNDFLGLDRWTAPPSSVMIAPLVTEVAAPAPKGPRVFIETSQLLSEVASGTDTSELSQQIQAADVVARLRAERQRPNTPRWMKSAAASVEAILIRAESAGTNKEEWETVRSYIARYDLVRVCTDLDVSAQLLFEGNRS